MRDEDARSDENPGEEEEHAHAVESGEGQIVRAQQDHQSGKKQVQVVETNGHKKQHGKWQHKRDLHPQAIEGILPAQGRTAARQTEHQLGERKDEKARDDGGEDGHLGSDPSAHRSGGQPNDRTDKLAPKAANKDRPTLALSVLDVHANLRKRKYGKPRKPRETWKHRDTRDVSETFCLKVWLSSSGG